MNERTKKTIQYVKRYNVMFVTIIIGFIILRYISVNYFPIIGVLYFWFPYFNEKFSFKRVSIFHNKPETPEKENTSATEKETIFSFKLLRNVDIYLVNFEKLNPAMKILYIIFAFIQMFFAVFIVGPIISITSLIGLLPFKFKYSLLSKNILADAKIDKDIVDEKGEIKSKLNVLRTFWTWLSTLGTDRLLYNAIYRVKLKENIEDGGVWRSWWNRIKMYFMTIFIFTILMSFIRGAMSSFRGTYDGSFQFGISLILLLYLWRYISMNVNLFPSSISLDKYLNEEQMKKYKEFMKIVGSIRSGNGI